MTRSGETNKQLWSYELETDTDWVEKLEVDHLETFIWVSINLNTRILSCHKAVIIMTRLTCCVFIYIYLSTVTVSGVLVVSQFFGHLYKISCFITMTRRNFRLKVAY